MKAALKKRWVTALRSGKYKQGQNGLRDVDCFCCLGVLCDLIDPSKWTASAHYEGRSCFIPFRTREAIGLSEANERKLAHMNDNGKSFREIAAYIAQRKTL